MKNRDIKDENINKLKNHLEILDSNTKELEVILEAILKNQDKLSPLDKAGLAIQLKKQENIENKIKKEVSLLQKRSERRMRGPINEWFQPYNSTRR